MPAPKDDNRLLPQHVLKSRSLRALTKHAHSMDDILAHSDVNEVLEKVVAKKSDIDEVLIIYKTHSDDDIHWIASELEYRECLWLMEVTKQSLMNDDTEE